MMPIALRTSNLETRVAERVVGGGRADMNGGSETTARPPFCVRSPSLQDQRVFPPVACFFGEMGGGFRTVCPVLLLFFSCGHKGFGDGGHAQLGAT